MGWSKEKRAEYMKNWREEHKEEIKQYRRDYYISRTLRSSSEDAEKQRLYCKEWRENNREKVREYNRNYQRKRRAMRAQENVVDNSP